MRHGLLFISLTLCLTMSSQQASAQTTSDPKLPAADDVFSPAEDVPAKPPAAKTQAKPMTTQEALKEIEALFAEDIARVTATATPKDDIELANILLIAAQNKTTAPAVVGALCDKTCELAGKTRMGLETAIAAAKIAVDRVPDRKIEFLTKLIGYQQKHLSLVDRSKRPQANHELVDSMVTLADVLVRTDDFDAALSWYQKASSLATVSQHSDQQAIVLGYSALRQLQVNSKKIKVLVQKLEDAPEDPMTHQELFRLYLIELDDPDKAFDFVTLGGTEEDQSFVLLAGLSIKDAPANDLLGLGDYYRALATKASEVARPAMLRRAGGYYEAYLASGKAKGLDKNKAQLILKTLYKQLGIDGPITNLRPAGGQVSGPTSPSALTAKGPHKIDDEMLAWAKQRDSLAPDEQINAIMKKLSELHNGAQFVLRGRSMRQGTVAQLDLSGNKGLVFLDPLIGMKLADLNLSGCSQLADLKALEDMPLKRLMLKGCSTLTSIKPLTGMELSQLDLGGCSSLKGNLSALADSKLTTLNLSGCASLKGLDGIEEQPITRIQLDGCSSLKGDLSALTDMPIRVLSMAGCSSLNGLSGLEGMKLAGKFSLADCRTLGGDLSALAGMKFSDLTLDNCAKLTSLNGLQKTSSLNRLQATGCSRLVVDFAMLTSSRKLLYINVQGAQSVANPDAVRKIRVQALNIDVQEKPTYVSGTRKRPSLTNILASHPTLRVVKTGLPKIDKQIAQSISTQLRKR
jgi:tetratricopeptide (TPR) repeat protein